MHIKTSITYVQFLFVNSISRKLGGKNCNKWHPHEAVFNRNIPRGHLQINGTTIKINEKIKWK